MQTRYRGQPGKRKPENGQRLASRGSLLEAKLSRGLSCSGRSGGSFRLSAFAFRPGFTLTELLVAMVIIAILIALALPAINSVRQQARIAQVRTDIADLESGLTNFKATYGVTPPSQITLYPPGAASAWDARSRGLIRRIWPQFNFADSGGMPSSAFPGGDPITLNGAECLLFFLGGRVDPSSGALVGFSKNPAKPFKLGGNREGPFIEVDSDRVVDQFPRSTGGNGFPEYTDPLPNQTMPYWYFSSYDGSGYRISQEVQPDSEPPNIGSPFFNVYTRGGTQWYKQQSYQIISPGFDGPSVGNPYGVGGVYDPDDVDNLLRDFDFDSSGTIEPDERREAERDNITNFHDGTLAD